MRPAGARFTGTTRDFSHQTGWTGLVAKLLQQSGERVEKTRAEEQDLEVGIV